MASADVEVVSDMEVEATDETDSEVTGMVADGFVPIDGSVTENKLANGSVTENKLANGSVTDAKLDPNGIRSIVDRLTTGEAVLESPMFTGVPTAPTAPAGTDTAQIATTAFVRQEMGAIGGPISAARIHEITGMGGD